MDIRSNIIRYGLMAACTAFLGLALQARAADCSSCTSSHGSVGLENASGFVAAGSIFMVAGTGSLIYESAAAVGDGVVLVFKNAANGAEVSVEVTADVARQLSNAAGASVQVVAISTGNVLVMSGKAIAFIPNQIGLALLHHTKLD